MAGGFEKALGLLGQRSHGQYQEPPSLRRLRTPGDGGFAQEAPSPQRRSREAESSSFLGEVTLPLPKGGDFGKESGFLSWESKICF